MPICSLSWDQDTWKIWPRLKLWVIQLPTGAHTTSSCCWVATCRPLQPHALALSPACRKLTSPAPPNKVIARFLGIPTPPVQLSPICSGGATSLPPTTLAILSSLYVLPNLRNFLRASCLNWLQWWQGGPLETKDTWLPLGFDAPFLSQ